MPAHFHYTTVLSVHAVPYIKQKPMEAKETNQKVLETLWMIIFRKAHLLPFLPTRSFPSLSFPVILFCSLRMKQV